MNIQEKILADLLNKRYNNWEEYTQKVDTYLKDNFKDLYFNYYDWDYERIYRKEKDGEDTYIASIFIKYEGYDNENSNEYDTPVIIEDIIFDNYERFLGKKWEELTEEEQNQLLSNANCLENEGDTIIDLTDNLSVAGHVSNETGEQIIEVDDKAIIYDPTL